MIESAMFFFFIFELPAFYRLLEEHGRISDRLHVHDRNVEFHLVIFFPRALFTVDLRLLPAKLKFVNCNLTAGNSRLLWSFCQSCRNNRLCDGSQDVILPIESTLNVKVCPPVDSE